MDHKTHAGLDIYFCEGEDRLIFRTVSRAADNNLYSHGPAHILSGIRGDATIGKFTREILSQCQPGISIGEIDRTYTLDFKQMLLKLDLKNKTEFFKRFKKCALYVYSAYFDLETQKREGRGAYSTFGNVCHIPLSASDSELGLQIRLALAASC